LILNIEDQLEWYENIPSTELYMIAEIDSNTPSISGKKGFMGSEVKRQGVIPIGVACYTEIDWFGHSCNISGSIYKEKRKQMQEVVQPAFSAGLDFAFEVLNMQRVGAEVLETHSAAQILEIGHLGFKIEGRRRRAVYKAGRYYDSIQLGILREEWVTHPRVEAYEGCCNDNFDHNLADKGIKRFNRDMAGALASGWPLPVDDSSHQ
jgi:RimJ/RimL family protein N-acetyltransferase